MAKVTADDAANLLSTWIALEVLSPPQLFRKPIDLAEGEARRIADLNRLPLPWIIGEKSRPNYRLFYQVVVGAIRMDDATAALLEAYNDTDFERLLPTGFAPIAILTLDSKGVPTEPNALAVSSFAWGLPIALRRDLAALDQWPSAELDILSGAEKVLQTKDFETAPAIGTATISRLYDHLVQRLALPAALVVPPEFALRVYQFWRAEEPPDPPPMGSFFLSDLAKAKQIVRTDNIPNMLQRYLGLALRAAEVDVRCDEVALSDCVAPSQLPVGCWPSPGDHALVLLQQAAVNLAVSSDARTKLLAVNGPPGTGKTTLLRDQVVALIVRRAEAMAAFSDPRESFKASGERRRSGNGYLQHYEPDTRLAGFEIVVASSNNKAVENISAELPSLKAIDDSYSHLRYFKTIADNVARGLRAGDGEDQTSAPHTALRAPASWGLIAAVLGNAKNKYAFRQTAWVDEDYGLRAYLLEAEGKGKLIERKDPASGRIVERRKPVVATEERPPSNNADAAKRWKRAQKRFLEASKRVSDRLAILEKGRQALSPDDLLALRHQAEQALFKIETDLSHINGKIAPLAEAIEHFKSYKQTTERSIAAHAAQKAGILGRLFGSSGHAEWERERERLSNLLNDISARLSTAVRAVDELRGPQHELSKQRAEANSRLEGFNRALSNVSNAINAATTICRARFVDAAFFDREPGDLQRDTPWIDPETNRLRKEVFVSAMEVHRAFVDCCAKEIRNNLDLLFKTFFGKSAWAGKMRDLMPGLWTTFFCVVPVISTTFAAFQRMFGYLEPEALGWLLIDEAGQAVPQAAVGALTRTRRAMIVGDPLQLPPVTSLPTELAEKIAAEFETNSERYVAPQASVQTLADCSSAFGTTIATDAGLVRVGVPLVVHRRCAEPMFSLSNNLAYGGMMVQGRGERPSAIRRVLGSSRWIDVKPDRCEDKWSVEEGRMVVSLFRSLENSGLDEIDVYVISPFRMVAQKTRELLVQENALVRWARDPRKWVKERVGTVYTVQGREADTVIFVLGAAQPERRGARAWAGQDVNQLNVAVTRAKENLYVIGNRFEWASAGTFSSLELKLS